MRVSPFLYAINHIFSIIGLVGYFKFLLGISSLFLGFTSPYLLKVQSVIGGVYNGLNKTLGNWVYIVFLVIFMAILYGYTRPIVNKEDRE